MSNVFEKRITFNIGRRGLIEVDWHNRMIKRSRAIKEYVTKRVVTSRMWPLAVNDWLRLKQGNSGEIR